MLARMRHPNLILFMGYCLTPELSIVSEFMHKGCLYNILREHDGVPLADGYARVVSLSVARAMRYLHTREPPILHLDLKSPNILIDSSWRVKVSDFGLSRIRNRTLVSGNFSGHGTPHWMSPETIRGEKIDEKSDVYSFGVILWELLTGCIPWEKLNPIQVIAAVGFKKRQLPKPDHPDTVLVKLMEACLSHDPHERPSFLEISNLLETHYQAILTEKRPLLDLQKNKESSDEPSSPGFGKIVEIFSSNSTASEKQTQTDPTLDKDHDLEDCKVSSELVNPVRNVEKLEAFAKTLESKSNDSDPRTIISPFAKLSMTPMDGETEDENEELLEVRSCDGAIENTGESSPKPSTTILSPFAAFSAMPFVDSGRLSGDFVQDDVGGISSCGDASTASQKTFKNQLSAVVDTFDEQYRFDIDEARIE